MPIKNSALTYPDPFIMNQNEVNLLIEKFLVNQSFENCVRSETGTEIDIVAEKHNWKLFVESRGSQAVKHDENTVFESSQLKIHLSEQIEQIMRFQQNAVSPILFIMSNPDIPRVKNFVNKINQGLDRLGIIRFWVNKDGKVSVDYPHHLRNILLHLKLIED